jgi:myo-inositol 2-dehydrogenase/D-chiro-inositol 1-dehydrogenase
MQPGTGTASASRRGFLRQTSMALAGVALAGDLGVRAYAAEQNTIKIALVGCGGRGTGAALNAMTADKGTRLVAMADLIMDRVKKGRTSLERRKPYQVAVDDNHCFAGFEGYKGVIEAADVILIANAAKFHPLHLKAGIEAGKHIFVEKPHAIDPAGIKVVRAACELAQKKNKCVVSGLHSRHHLGYKEAIQRVHDGAIGEIVAIEENFLRAPYVLYPRQPGMTEVEYQGSNQYHFHWLSGDDVPQSLVHNLDRASWALHEKPPLKAHGMGGRSTLRGEIYGNVFDHHAVVYEYENGLRLYAFCRTIPECYNDSSSVILGSKGRCNVTKMRIEGEKNWRYEGDNLDPYLIEHQKLFQALRAGKVINNGDYMVRSTLMGIMGQITCYSGKEVTYEQISASDFCFLPKPEDCRFDMEPPVKLDANGFYPVAFTPGESQLL